MSISIDPATGLKVFNTRAASAMEDVIGRGYAVVEGEALTTLPPQPPGAVFNAQEQARYREKYPLDVRAKSGLEDIVGAQTNLAPPPSAPKPVPPSAP